MRKRVARAFVRSGTRGQRSKRRRSTKRPSRMRPLFLPIKFYLWQICPGRKPSESRGGFLTIASSARRARHVAICQMPMGIITGSCSQMSSAPSVVHGGFGELDVAVVLLPEGKTAPPPLLTNSIASDRMEIVQGAAGNVEDNWKSLGRAPWVLNPPECPLRARLLDRMERYGFTPMIAAEVHNMHLQLAFVQSGYGLGLLPARFIARNHSIDTVKVLRPPSFDLHPTVAIVRAGQLGALGKAVEQLEHGFRQVLEASDTTKPVTRHRKGVPENRRAARARK